MLAIIAKELRDRRVSLAAYSIIGLVFVVMYMSLYPTIQRETANYTQLLQSLPKGYSQAFGIDQSSFTSFQSFLAVELFSLTWPLLMILLATSRAGAALGGEVERGTMRTLLSLPVSRRGIYLGKYLAGLVSVGVFVLLTILAVIPLAKVFNLTITTSRFLDVAALGFLFGLAVYSAALLISAFTSDRGKVYMTIGGLLLLMYVANIVSGLVDSLKWLERISVFHYFKATELLAHGTVNASTNDIFAGVAVVSLVLGLLWFDRRDIPA